MVCAVHSWRDKCAENQLNRHTHTHKEEEGPLKLLKYGIIRPDYNKKRAKIKFNNSFFFFFKNSNFLLKMDRNRILWSSARISTTKNGCWISGWCIPACLFVASAMHCLLFNNNNNRSAVCCKLLLATSLFLILANVVRYSPDDWGDLKPIVISLMDWCCCCCCWGSWWRDERMEPMKRSCVIARSIMT